MDAQQKFENAQQHYNQLVLMTEAVTDQVRKNNLLTVVNTIKDLIWIINQQSCYISAQMTVRTFDVRLSELEEENAHLKRLCNEYGVPLQDRFRKGVYTFY